jgi:lysophospholipase L1-like esterase
MANASPGGLSFTGSTSGSSSSSSVTANAATNRAPGVADNTATGYTTNSIWQQNGIIYNAAVYSAADSAAWVPAYESAIGTPVDVMTTAISKFAGGTVALLKAFTGPAIDVAMTIAGVYQIFTINILANGELDNVSLGAVLAQADAATVARVIKIYDQTGNGNHAALGTATGVPCAVNATVTTSTTLTVNSVTTGTVAVAQFVFGNGITAGTTISSGAGPYVLSTGSPLNPGPEAMYLGITSPPYIDWDPVMQRYMIYAPNEQTNGSSTNKRALQIPQTATFTNANNIGAYAVGVGVNSSDTSQPCVAAIGDSSVGSGFYQAIFGGTGGAQNLNGQIIITQNGTAHTVPTTIKNSPCVLILGTAATPLTTVNVNEDQGTVGSAITSQAVAGGWIFSYGGGAIVPYSMMKLVGLALFNAAPTATQSQQMRYGAYARFNIFPQVINQVALIGDSRLANFNVTPGFGVSNILPRLIGRNWDVLNMSTHSQPLSIQIGDGLNPTVTGIAKSLQTFKKPGLNYAVILGGVNDVSINASTAAQVVALLQTLCAQIVSAGWTPVLIAELTTTTATNNANTVLPQINALIVSMGAAAFSGAQIINLYGYVPVTTPANSAYYYSGLHPTPAVHGIIASAIAAILPKTS